MGMDDGFEIRGPEADAERTVPRHTETHRHLISPFIAQIIAVSLLTHPPHGIFLILLSTIIAISHLTSPFSFSPDSFYLFIYIYIIIYMSTPHISSDVE